jgi:F-type H+-transporting ATPase subunit b
VDILGIAIAVFNALFIVGLLCYFLRKPAREMLEQRAERIRGELDQAADDTSSALSMIQQYRQKLAGVTQERTAILAEASKVAEERKKMMLLEAESEAAGVRARARVEIDAQQHLVNDQIHHAIVEISSETAKKLLLEAMDKAVQDRLFNEILAELEAMVFAPAMESTRRTPCQI